jgi:hypothetical protein
MWSKFNFVYIQTNIMTNTKTKYWKKCTIHTSLVWKVCVGNSFQASIIVQAPPPKTIWYIRANIMIGPAGYLSMVGFKMLQAKCSWNKSQWSLLV